MNDVIPPCGGYLPVYIEPNGYIVGIESDADVHLETRRMHEWRGCFESFMDAKAYIKDIPEDSEFVAILQLTGEGGGAALWTLPEHVEEVTRLRNIWRGCYGTWPVQPLSI